MRDDFKRHQEKNRRFSLRAYAKKIGISAGSLSEILNGTAKWELSLERALTILEKLAIPSGTKNRVLIKMGKKPQHKKRSMTKEDHGLLANWFYYPILFSFDLPESLRTPEKIARRFNLELENVSKIIADQVKRGLLTKDENGKIKRPQEYISTNDHIPLEVIRKYHEATLHKAQRALTKIPVEKIDFTSLVFVGSKKNMDLFRKKIREFYDEIPVLMNGETENDHVYQLSVQLFPTEQE